MATTSLSPAARPVLGQKLQNAVSEFSSVLDEDQRVQLNQLAPVPDADAILVFTAQLDSSHPNRRGRSFATRLHTILLAVRNFCTVVDVFVSSHPEIAALVWGSVRLTMMVISNYTSYYEATSDLFMRVGRLCPLFDEYLALYRNSRRLQQALIDFHTAIVCCCKHVVEAVQRPWRQQLLRAFINSFEQEFKSDIDSIQTCSDRVNEEIALAQAQADFLEREEASNTRSMTQKLLSHINTNSNKTRHSQKMIAERKTQKRRQQLLDSVSTYDHLRPLKHSLLKRYANTSDWIFQTPEFKQWVDGAFPLLCCFGKIGSGKTIATASIVRHILSEETSHCSVSFFFVESGNRESLTADTIVRSLLRQRLTSGQIPQQIIQLLEQLDSFSSLDEFVKLLHATIPPPRPSYIVVDGLDECERQDRRRLLAALSQVSALGENVRLLLSSRDSLLGEIRKEFKAFKSFSMNCPDAHDGISIFIRDIVSNKIQNEELNIGDPTLEEDIKLALIGGAQGMFLWVTFQLDEICAQHCDQDIRDTLMDLPKNLADLYCRVLRRVKMRGHRTAAQKVFSWLSASKDLLTLGQLREAIAIEIGQQHTKPETLYNDMKGVTTWCENLVLIDEEYQLVQFAHSTIRQFLIEEPLDPTLTEFHINLPEVDHDIGEKCVTYLNFSDFQTAVAERSKPLILTDNTEVFIQAALGSHSRSASLLRRLRPKLASKPVNLSKLPAFTSQDSTTRYRTLSLAHPFLDYASVNWILHTTNFQPKKSKTWDIWETMLMNGHHIAQFPWEFCNADSSSAWAIDAHHYALIRILHDSGQLPAPLASLFILKSASGNDIEIMAYLLARNDIDDKIDFMLSTVTKDRDSLEEYGPIARHLISTGRVKINESDLRDQPPLSRAVINSRFEVVRFLLTIEEIDLNVRDSKNRTPLIHATASGNGSITEILLAEPGVDPNARDTIGETALSYAVQAGYEEMVKLLLSSKTINPDIGGVGNHTPLSLAVQRGNGSIVQLLMNYKTIRANPSHSKVWS